MIKSFQRDKCVLLKDFIQITGLYLQTPLMSKIIFETLKVILLNNEMLLSLVTFLYQ